MFEMTMEEVNDCFEFMGVENNPKKKLGDWLFRDRRQDLSGLTRAGVLKVNRG